MLAVLVFVGFVCFFVLVVVVGVFCVVCFGGLFFWLCGWFGLFFGVCLVVVVEVGGGLFCFGWRIRMNVFDFGNVW